MRRTLGAALLACAAVVSAVLGAQARAISVLFVGNSLTYVNDLPGTFQRFAAATPARPAVKVLSVVAPGALLSQHWKSGEAAASLQRNHPDFLVLQGQSTEPLGVREDFFRHVALFKEEADRAGTKTVLFSTWARPAGDPYYAEPSSGGSPLEMQSRLDAAYAEGAARTHAELAPVGLAFRLAGRVTPRTPLLDGTQHPSTAGTYLAAAVLYRVIFSASPVDSTYASGLPPATADALRNVAASVPLHRP